MAKGDPSKQHKQNAAEKLPTAPKEKPQPLSHSSPITKPADPLPQTTKPLGLLTIGKQSPKRRAPVGNSSDDLSSSVDSIDRSLEVMPTRGFALYSEKDITAPESHPIASTSTLSVEIPKKSQLLKPPTMPKENIDDGRDFPTDEDGNPPTDDDLELSPSPYHNPPQDFNKTYRLDFTQVEDTDSPRTRTPTPHTQPKALGFKSKSDIQTTQPESPSSYQPSSSSTNSHLAVPNQLAVSDSHSPTQNSSGLNDSGFTDELETPGGSPRSSTDCGKITALQSNPELMVIEDRLKTDGLLDESTARLSNSVETQVKAEEISSEVDEDEQEKQRWVENG